ncbi:unnamed protein product [Lupinus luteus]|uniref:Uncharacterized protein n=1 Tax=Lupinus luteus TaxID=3873 RepID=A0AAV1XA66_LUPLU
MVGVWSIWQCINDAIFNNKRMNLEELLDEIIFKAWLWIKSRLIGTSISWFECVPNPILCLNGYG